MPFTHSVAITPKGERWVILGVRKRLALYCWGFEGMPQGAGQGLGSPSICHTPEGVTLTVLQ